jgi:amino acid transporter
LADTRKGVFVRESTGLVKNVTLLDALSLNLGSMGVGLALASLGYTMVLLPSVTGVNMLYASVIGLLIVIPQMIVYQMFITRITRTGGDYVWASRTLGGAVGGVVAFAGAIMIQLAYGALTIISMVFAIGSVGLAVGNNGFLGIALPGNSGGDPALQFVIGAIFFGAIVGVNLVRPKMGYRLVSFSIVAGIILLALATVILLGAGQHGVENYINGLGAVNSNNSTITYNSVASSYTGSTFNLGNTLLFMPYFIFFVYPWFATAAPTAGSEFKGKGTTRFNIPLSLVISFVFVTVPLAVMYYVGGFGFTNAALANPTLVYDYSFNFWTLAMGVTGSVSLSVVIGIGWILWDVALLGYLVISFSRYIMAQGFDRFLPSRFADINKYGSPWVAQVFDLIVTLLVAGLAAFLYGTFSSLYGIAMNNWIWFITIGIAAITFAVRKLQGSARAIMAICGALMTVIYIYISYIFLDYPGIWGGNNLAYGYDVVVFVLGAAIYAGSYYYNKARNIDITLSFKEIPPE